MSNVTTTSRQSPTDTARIIRKGIAAASKLADLYTVQALAADTEVERNEWEALVVAALADADELRADLARLSASVTRCARRYGYTGR